MPYFDGFPEELLTPIPEQPETQTGPQQYFEADYTQFSESVSKLADTVTIAEAPPFDALRLGPINPVIHSSEFIKHRWLADLGLGVSLVRLPGHEEYNPATSRYEQSTGILEHWVDKEDAALFQEVSTELEKLKTGYSPPAELGHFLDKIIDIAPYELDTNDGTSYEHKWMELQLISAEQRDAVLTRSFMLGCLMLTDLRRISLPTAALTGVQPEEARLTIYEQLRNRGQRPLGIEELYGLHAQVFQGLLKASPELATKLKGR